jgi:hypothetical protein
MLLHISTLSNLEKMIVLSFVPFLRLPSYLSLNGQRVRQGEKSRAMEEDMHSSLQKKGEKCRRQLSDLEERLQRLEQLKSRLSRLRETNQENMILPNATYPQMAHASNTISNASLRNVQHLTIEDVDDEMEANRDDTDDQVLWVTLLF